MWDDCSYGIPNNMLIAETNDAMVVGRMSIPKPMSV